MPIAFLLALQASGMVIDWLGKNEQIRMSRMGQKVEEASINSNIMSSRLEAEDESVRAMKQLRSTMGSQAAILAARGTAGNVGSALAIKNESISNFNADSRMRQINQLSREAALKAGMSISKMHEKSFENNTWNEFRQGVLKNVPTSSQAWGKIGEGFGLTSVGGG